MVSIYIEPFSFMLTQTGWMMWNWLVGLLTVGGTCVLYDGSPLIPNANILWDLIDKLSITILGTGAKWLAVLEDKGIKPSKYCADKLELEFSCPLCVDQILSVIEICTQRNA
mgnify:CR=1 FL=1